MKMMHTLAVIAATTVVGSALQPAAAQAAANDLVIVNGGAVAILVCKDWGTTQCAGGFNSYKWLYPQQSTKTDLGWADADGLYLQSTKVYFKNGILFQSCGQPSRDLKRGGTGGAPEVWAARSC